MEAGNKQNKYMTLRASIEIMLAKAIELLAYVFFSSCFTLLV